MADNEKLLKAIRAETTALKKELKNLSKEGTKDLESLEKAAKGFNEQLKDTPQYFKGIEKFAKVMRKVEKATEEVADDLKKMGVENSVQVAKMTKELDRSSKALKGLVKNSKDMSILQSKLTIMPEKLKDLQKGLKDGFSKDELGGFIEGLDDIESMMDPKQFEQLKASMKKAYDNPYLHSYKDALEDVSNIYLKNILKDFQTIDNIGLFENLDENSKNFLKNLIDSGGAVDNIEDLQEALEKIDKLQPDINKSFDDFSKKNESEIRKLNDELKKTTGIVDDLNKMFLESSFLEINLGNLEAEADSVINEIKQRTGDLALFPEDTIDSVKKVQGHIATISKERKKLVAINKRIDTLGDKDLGMKKKLLEYQKQITARINESAIAMKETAEYAREYLDAAEEVDRNKFGLPQTKAMSKALFKGHHRAADMAKLLGDKFPKLGKMFEGISGKLKGMGHAMSALKFPMGLLAVAGSMASMIKSVESRAADMYKPIQDSGLLVGVTADNAREEMKKLFDETNNLANLTKAASGFSDEFALSREEILGTANALDQAGLKAKNLRKQMEGVEVKGISKDLSGAATAVRTFSYEMGTSDDVVAGIMGNMTDQFNSTMSSMIGNVTEITNSVNGSNLSLNRFLGILGTSTAGLSLYEEQVSDTAREIGRLSQNAKLSGSDIEKVTKITEGFGKNMEQTALTMGTLFKKMPNAKKAVSEAISGKMEELKVKIAQTKDPAVANRLQNQLDNSEKMLEAIKANNYYEAAALAERSGQTKAMNVMKGYSMKMVQEMSKGSVAAEKQFAAMYGLEEAMDANAASGGELQKSLISGQEGAKKSFEDMRKIGAKKDKLLGKGLEKAEQAIKDQLVGEVAEHTILLRLILAAITAMAAASIWKNWGTFTSFFTEGGMFKGITEGLKGVLSPALSSMTGSLSRMLPMLAKVAGSGAALAAAGAAGWYIGKAFNESDAGKALTKWITKDAGELNKDEKKQLSDFENKMLAKTNKRRKEKGLSEFKSFAELEADVKKKREMRKAGLLPPAAVSRSGGGGATPSATARATGAATSSISVSGAGGGTPVNIVVNGNDELRMKRMILEAINQAKRGNGS